MYLIQYNLSFCRKSVEQSRTDCPKRIQHYYSCKPRHEETRATFSHSAAGAPSVIVKDMEEAICLGKYITGESNLADFEEEFKGKFSEGFDPEKNLRRIGIVNQTTMLASDTQAIADYFKALMISHYQLTDQTIAEHFADKRHLMLCYKR